MGSAQSSSAARAAPPPAAGQHRLLHLLSLPEELMLIIATHLPQEDRLRLPGVCRALRQACSAPTLFPTLDLDLTGVRWMTTERASELHLALRRWVLLHASGIRSLTIHWPGYDPDSFLEIPEPLVWSLQLTVASVLTALAPHLQHLQQTFTCYVPWSDALLPLGAGGACALRSLHMRRCHLSSVAGLASLGRSLTELSISLCDGFAEGHSLPGLPATLRALPLLECLTLDTLFSDPVPDTLGSLTRLTSLSLVNVALDADEGFKLPASCSALTRLASLRIEACGMQAVPALVEHLTGLRTLLLSNNELGTARVPPGLSALNGLASLDLSHNMLAGVPGACAGCQLGVLARGLGKLAFHALQHLTRLNLRCCGLYGLTLVPGPYLSHLQELDITGTDIRLPPGNYPALQQLAANHCAHSDTQAALAALPALPALRQLEWRNNAKLKLDGARLLLRKAPALKELQISKTSAYMTPPAAKLLREAGVALEPGVAA